MLLMNNPEFKRNVWLQISKTRLILMPFILLCIYGFSLLLGEEIHKTLIHASRFMLNLILLLWGSSIAANAVLKEVQERTWLNQRLSALSPLEMLIGKLFGSTVYAWYGGLICIVVYLCNIPFAINPAELLLELFNNLVLIIGVHSFLIAASIWIRFKNPNFSKINIGLIVGVLVVGFLVWSIFAGLMSFFMDEPMQLIEHTLWFGVEMGEKGFILIHLLFFAVWSAIALYRNLRREFHYFNGIVYWAIFLGSLSILMLGWHKDSITDKLVQVLLVNMLMFYVVMLTEVKSLYGMRIMFNNLRKKIVLDLPLWSVSLVFTLLIVSIFVVVLAVSGEEAFALPILVLLYMMRDAFLVLFLNFSTKFKRPDSTFLVLALLLYIIFPVFSGGMGFDFPIAGFFVPWEGAEYMIPKLVFISIQVLIVGFFAIKKYKIYARF